MATADALLAPSDHRIPNPAVDDTAASGSEW